MKNKLKLTDKEKQLINLRDTLVEKLSELPHTKPVAEIIIDTFLSVMITLNFNEDDRLKVLEDCKDYFVDGDVRDQLIYEATAIKVNYGY